jgi:hypothetical protein
VSAFLEEILKKIALQFNIFVFSVLIVYETAAEQNGIVATL